MENKVYIVHEGGFANQAIDCFIRSDKDLTKEECEEYDIDYRMPGCPFVKEFLEKHKDFRYVGSTDNGHCDGEYGMDLSGWKKVDVSDQ